jgi:hypothetical protein
MKISLISLLFLSAILINIMAEPSRNGGISLHQLPQRVAELSGAKGGFTVTYANYLAPEKEQPVLQSADEVIAYLKKQTSQVQQNGIWVVTTHPDAYSDEEKQVLEDVKAACKKDHIPLFICRGSELPNGWKRFDQ